MLLLELVPIYKNLIQQFKEIDLINMGLDTKQRNVNVRAKALSLYLRRSECTRDIFVYVHGDNDETLDFSNFVYDNKFTKFPSSS